jgi:hypothetical protein
MQAVAKNGNEVQYFCIKQLSTLHAREKFKRKFKILKPSAVNDLTLV